MKVAMHVVKARRERLARFLQRHRYVPIQEVCEKFEISEATARRDLTNLARARRIQRTYGGALSDYDSRFASFHERSKVAGTDKQQIARKAYRRLRPRETYFFDSGTTVHTLAEHLAQDPIELTVVTNNLVVAETLGVLDLVQVHILGGRFLHRQSIVLDVHTRAALAQWKFAAAFLGAEGFDEQGIWNSHDEVVRFQQDIMARSATHYFCLDQSKLGRRAPSFLTGWKKVAALITNASRAELRDRSISLQPSQHIHV